jgi:MFS family permease
MRTRAFLALCLFILIVQLGWGIITPVLPSYARSFGMSNAAVGWVIGIYGLARFVANVPAGQIAERRGRRTVLVLGTLITAIASALMATATGPPQLLFYRLLTGLGAASMLTGAQVIVGDLATSQNRGRMLSMYQGFFVLGVGLGPAIGGVVADQFGQRAPFFAYSLLTLAGCGIALLFIKETRPAARPHLPAPSDTGAAVLRDGSVWSVLRSSAFLLIGVVSFVQFLARTGAMFTVVPLLGEDRLGLSASQIGFALALPNLLNLAVVYHAGVLTDRLGRKRAIVPATLICGMAMALFAVAQSYAVYVLAAAVWGIGSGIAGPAPAAYVADITPDAMRGRVFGLYRSVADSGYIVGPLVLGWLAGASGYTAPLVLVCGLFLCSATLFGRLAPETRRTGASVPLAPLAGGSAH